MFGGGAATRWTREQLIALARREVFDAIQAGHGDYAKTKTRELVRLCVMKHDGRADPAEPPKD